MAKKKPPKPTAGLPVVAKAQELMRPNSMLLFGQPKRGKTSLAASICKVKGIENVLLIDIDGGSAAIAQDYPEVDVLRVKRGDLKTFLKVWKEIVDSDGMYGGVQYDAIIVDTLTMLQEWVEAGVATSNGYEKWGEIKKSTLQIMWDLHEMTPIGIATLHTKVQNIMRGSEDSDSEYIKLNPALMGSAGQSIGAIPDLIGFCDVREADEDDEEEDIVYYVQLKPSDEHNTGNRYRNLPYRLEDASMKRIFEFIDNKKG